MAQGKDKDAPQSIRRKANGDLNQPRGRRNSVPPLLTISPRADDGADRNDMNNETHP